MFLTYFDKQFSKNNETWKYYCYVFYIQILLTVFVVIYYLLNVYIDILNKQYRTNIERIHHSIYLPCITGHVLCMVQRVLLIGDFQEGTDPNNPVFYYISLCRAIVCFPGFFAILALVAERSFATYFLDDYERNQRSWLVFIILFAIYTVGFLSAMIYHQSTNTIPIVITFLALGSLGVIANEFNFRLNKKYYKKSHRADGGGYSLGQRFQISENIRISQFFNHYAKSVAFFTTFGPLCLLVDNFQISVEWKNLKTVVFDFTVLMYAYVTPYVVYYYNPKYQAQLRLIFKTIRINYGSAKVLPSKDSAQVYDTFGNQLVFDNSTQTLTYFQQLNQSWR